MRGEITTEFALLLPGLPIGIKNDSHKKIKIFAVEISDYAQLSGFVFRGYSASLNLVTQPLRVCGIKPLGRVCFERKSKLG